jgi:hypothetical protein
MSAQPMWESWDLRSPAADERGTALLHSVLDAEIAFSRAASDLKAAREKLAAFVAAVNAARSTPVASVASVASVATPAAPELDEQGHHPSFTHSERRWFYGSLGALCRRRGFDKKLAESLSEVSFKRIRPSAMPGRFARSDYLLWLETPEGIDAYEAHHAAHTAELAASLAEEPAIRCENCGRNAHPVRCQHCDWRHEKAA